ncbi:c-type cytochrome [Sphingobium nicotianae]|nr:cytochrome c [Sphingobium nicotianae]
MRPVRWTIAALLLLVPSLAHANGAATYSSRCAMCHRPDGAGLPGQFPRLSGRVGQIAGAKDGRVLLGKILLYGMYGSITVDGKPLTGLMPPMGSLPDQDIADVLNHVASFKKAGKPPAPFTAAEIAALRATRLSSAAVGAERASLAAKGVVVP